MDTLALTDRDGVYGAVKFARAAQSAGIRPVLGVDLAVEPSGLLAGPPMVHPSLRRMPAELPAGGWPARPAPSRRGAAPRSTRGTRGSPCSPRTRRAGRRCAGWSRRPTCAASAASRSPPSTWSPSTSPWPGPAAAGCWSCSGPGSEVGRALTVAAARPGAGGARPVARRRRPRRPAARGGVPPRSRRPAARRPDAAAGDRGAADRRPHQRGPLRRPPRRPTTDVLDASRRLVALDARHVDRVNAEGYLKSGKEMALVAEEVVSAAGVDDRAARRLLAATRRVADRCAVDPRADLGMGEVHFPDLEVLGGGQLGRPTRCRPPRRCCGSGARPGWAGARWPRPRRCAGGSTTSSASSSSSATRRTSSPSPTSST